MKCSEVKVQNFKQHQFIFKNVAIKLENLTFTQSNHKFEFTVILKEMYFDIVWNVLHGFKTNKIKRSLVRIS